MRTGMVLREIIFTVSSFLSAACRRGRMADAGPIPIVPPNAPGRLNRS